MALDAAVDNGLLLQVDFSTVFYLLKLIYLYFIIFTIIYF